MHSFGAKLLAAASPAVKRLLPSYLNLLILLNQAPAFLEINT